METDSTYLEDFVQSLDMLPNDARRDFEVMKELDRECIDLNRELIELETFCLTNRNIRSQKLGTGALDEEKLNEIDEAFHTTYTKMMTLRSKVQEKLNEKTATAHNLGSIVDRFCKKLDADLAFFETDLKGCGEFETPKGAEPGCEVAFTTGNEGDADRTFVLGRVIAYHADSGEYDILDVDDSSTFLLPEEQVIVLEMMDSTYTQRHGRLSKGEGVYALYPDTTCFYLAVVSQAPRRTSAGAEPSVIVQFIGDEDETGTVPHRTVPLKYVCRLPDPPDRIGDGAHGAAAAVVGSAGAAPTTTMTY